MSLKSYYSTAVTRGNWAVRPIDRKGKNINKVKRSVGYIEGYFETGCEGIRWAFFEEREGMRDAREGMVFLDAGDHLTIFSPDGGKIFEGHIIQDRETGAEVLPDHPTQQTQQIALGFWIHWTQQGWHPDDWAILFVKHWLEIKDAKSALMPLRAVLIRKEASL